MAKLPGWLRVTGWTEDGYTVRIRWWHPGFWLEMIRRRHGA